MKNFLTLSVLSFLISFSYALTPEDILQKYRNYEGARIDTINQKFWQNSGLTQPRDLTVDYNHLNILTLISLTGCTEEVKTKFYNDIKNLEQDEKYRILEIDRKEDNIDITVLWLTSGKPVKYYSFFTYEDIAGIAIYSEHIWPPLYFTKDQLCEDADSLISIIYDVHPDMFAVYPEKDFMEEFYLLKNSFTDSMSRIDFYRIMTPLIAKLGDGHTGIMANNIFTTESLYATVLPFDIFFRKDGSLTISKDLTEEYSFLESSELLSLNGHTAPELRKELIGYKSGELESFRISQLNRESSGTPLFGTNYYIIYGNSPDYDIVVRHDGKIETYNIKGRSFTELSEARKKIKTVSRKNFNLIIDSVYNTGIMTINTFNGGEKNNFDKFLHESFGSLKKNDIENLIIDIRYNGGGSDDLVEELIGYISPVPYKILEKSTVKYSRNMKEFLKKNNPDWYMESFFYSDGLHTFNFEETAPREESFRYNGNIYMLISNYTFSSAATCAWIFRQAEIGTIVGEEAGEIGITFGNALNFTLPNTHIVFRSSCKKFYQMNTTDESDIILHPDFYVTETEALDKAKELIGTNKN